MQQQTTRTDLFDLINNKYFELRNMNEIKWHDTNNITITNSEWYIISFLYNKQLSISELAKQLGISRQAAHKSIKALYSKGLIYANHLENNNRNKIISLTSIGDGCYLNNKEIKKNIEDQIIEKLGSDKMDLLIELLNCDWV